MFSMFTDPIVLKYSKVTHKDSMYVLDRLSKEVDNVVSYYSQKVSSLENNHILVRLIRTLTADIDLDYNEYKNLIRSRANYVCKSLGIGTPLNESEEWSGTFYNVTDVLLTTIELDYDMDTLYADWETLSPIQVLWHPYDSTVPVNVDPRLMSDKDGYVVIGIDPILVKLIHREWQKEQLFIKTMTGVMLTDNHFAAMVLVPSMIKSHVEIALFNRAVNVFMDTASKDKYKKQPILINGYEDRVDDILLEYTMNHMGTKHSYIKYLQSLPSIYNNSTMEIMSIPGYTSTRHNYKYFLLSRLEVMFYLYNLGGVEGKISNKDLISKGRIQINRLYRDRTLMATLHKSVKEKVVTLIDALKK